MSRKIPSSHRKLSPSSRKTRRLSRRGSPSCAPRLPKVKISPSKARRSSTNKQPPAPLEKEREELLHIYRLLLDHFGPRNWWPAETPFEVMIGAILTQNTAWINVEKAIAALKQADLLSPHALHRLPLPRLAQLIRPSGYFNQKARRLKEFVRFFLGVYHGSAETMARVETERLREQLLALPGIGPETADSILLYALNKPVFVVDAYTRRAFARLGFLPGDADYLYIQKFFTDRLPPSLPLYNDYHAQIVWLGKEYCRSHPRCPGCPLEQLGRCSTALLADF